MVGGGHPPEGGQKRYGGGSVYQKSARKGTFHHREKTIRALNGESFARKHKTE